MLGISYCQLRRDTHTFIQMHLNQEEMLAHHAASLNSNTTVPEVAEGMLLKFSSSPDLGNLQVSVSIDLLFRIFHVNGVIWYVTFCIWLFSLSIKFLRFICIVLIAF